MLPLRDLSELTPLPHSGREAEAIAGLVPKGKGRLVALGAEANRELVLGGSLAGYRVVHFATHAVIDPERPDLSGLVLSLADESGAPQDGFLRLHEVYSLALPAELVVLSACQTGLGRELAGEGLVGLTHGFLHAGARGVIHSLWSVDDRATAELMRRFYRHLLTEGRSAAAALRMAQNEMAEDPELGVPYYWSGFVLLGDWRSTASDDDPIERADGGGSGPMEAIDDDLPPPIPTPEREPPPPGRPS